MADHPEGNHLYHKQIESNSLSLRCFSWRGIQHDNDLKHTSRGMEHTLLNNLTSSQAYQLLEEIPTDGESEIEDVLDLRITRKKS
ncbi:hypothetical protein Trydic_g258 [Trypoxylus dichotomus]